MAKQLNKRRLCHIAGRPQRTVVSLLRFLVVLVISAGFASPGFLPAGFFTSGPAAGQENVQPTPFHLNHGEIWRSPDRDGLNCLYFFLKMSGASVTYDQLEQGFASGRQTSLLDLKIIAHQYGVNAQVVKARFDHPGDLAMYHLPAIALMDEPRHGGSGFISLIQVGDAWFQYIDGGSVTWTEVSRDEFLRKWSGYLLVVEPAPPPPGFQRFASYLVALLILGVYIAYRFRTKAVPVAITSS